MNTLLNAPFLQEMVRTVSEMYRHGWDERNGGNLSLLLDAAEVRPYVAPDTVLRNLPLGFAAPELAGRYVLVTATGSYFRNICQDPERDLGLLRIAPDGRSADLCWGFRDGGAPTSELPSHLMSHVARLRQDPQHRVVLHCHPDHLIAMTYVHDLDPRAFTRTLWQMCTECMMVFPDGVNVLPWMLCGTESIGLATAEQMLSARLVVWAHHGIYGTGRSLEDAFGLVETAEKAAGIYLQIAHLPRKQTITDDQLRQLADHLGLSVRPGYLAAPSETP
jgi:rhamnulose-1-phosphate aldolase